MAWVNTSNPPAHPPSTPPAHKEELYPPCLDNKDTLCVYAWSTKGAALEVAHVFLRAGFRDAATKFNRPMYKIYTSNHNAIKVCFNNPLDASLLYERGWQTGAEVILFTGYHDAMHTDDFFPDARFIHRLGLGSPLELGQVCTVKLIGLPRLHMDAATMRQIITDISGTLVKVLPTTTSIGHFVKASFRDLSAVPHHFDLPTPSY